LPLSGFVPDHPSLDSVTVPSNWHTGLDNDPWAWRDRLAGEGVAAYGRFFAKKPVFIAAELFPLFVSALQPAKTVQERYEDGELSQKALRVYDAIRSDPGIEVRDLRKASGLHAQSDKLSFDKALIELQESFEIVIRGFVEKRNDQGGKSGWSGTGYTPADKWLDEHGFPVPDKPFAADSAKHALKEQLHLKLRPNAAAFMLKKLKL
jgi:hypothetical protein